MKVNFKRVATAALAVAMSLSLNVPAFAAGNGGDRTLTVKGDTLDNKDVYAVQMFTARATGTDSFVFDNYELADDDWLAFFNATTEEGGMGMTNADADKAREYVEKLKDTSLVDFADKAQAWVRSHTGNFTVIASDSEDSPVADKATFTHLQAGYYLVYPEGGSTGTEKRGTDAMLVNVPQDNNAEWDIKSTFPTVDKKVDTNITAGDNHGDATNNGSAQVGDTVTFTLTSAVPDMTDYGTFYFAFNDTLSNGLEFVKAAEDVEVTDVTVTIGEQSVTEGYTVSLTGNKLSVVFNDLKSVDGADVGDAIVVTYKAMITEAAATKNPATNTVEVEYSNDPNGVGHGTSTPDESKVYTYDIDVNKWANDVDGGKTGSLAGAKFVLSTSETLADGENDASVIKLINTDSGTGNAYRVAKPGEESAKTSFITTDSGDITISGLEGSTEPGTTYYLHEIEAPDGYNKLKAPVEIVIKIDDMDTGDATITVNGVGATGADGNVIDVENKKGIELPETGSIGTIGLTALGVVVVVAGLFAFPRKKKTRQD